METRNHKRGVVNPANAMIRELEQEKIKVAMYNRKQRRLLCGVEDGDDSQEDVVEEAGDVQGRMHRLVVEDDDEIVYEDE